MRTVAIWCLAILLPVHSFNGKRMLPGVSFPTIRGNLLGRRDGLCIDGNACADRCKSLRLPKIKTQFLAAKTERTVVERILTMVVVKTTRSAVNPLAVRPDRDIVVLEKESDVVPRAVAMIQVKNVAMMMALAVLSAVRR
jgi:hypothetical protein